MVFRNLSNNLNSISIQRYLNYMEKTQEQLTQPLVYEYNDPEYGAGQAPASDPAKPFNEPAPTVGQEWVPPVGTVPQPQLLNAFSRALIKKLNEASATYEGATNAEGNRHGKGKLTYVDGTSYEGNFQDGKREGHGQ